MIPENATLLEVSDAVAGYTKRMLKGHLRERAKLWWERFILPYGKTLRRSDSWPTYRGGDIITAAMILHYSQHGITLRELQAINGATASLSVQYERILRGEPVFLRISSGPVAAYVGRSAWGFPAGHEDRDVQFTIKNRFYLPVTPLICAVGHSISAARAEVA